MNNTYTPKLDIIKCILLLQSMHLFRKLMLTTLCISFVSYRDYLKKKPKKIHFDGKYKIHHWYIIQYNNYSKIDNDNSSFIIIFNYCLYNYINASNIKNNHYTETLLKDSIIIILWLLASSSYK